MSTKTFLALLALLLLRLQLFGQEPNIRARCVGVTDGDTVKVLTADQQLLRIRLAWIDSPEMGQAFGYRAKQATANLFTAASASTASSASAVSESQMGSCAPTAGSCPEPRSRGYHQR